MKPRRREPDGSRGGALLRPIPLSATMGYGGMELNLCSATTVAGGVEPLPYGWLRTSDMHRSATQVAGLPQTKNGVPGAARPTICGGNAALEGYSE